jgi:N-methylhydantoinase A
VSAAERPRYTVAVDTGGTFTDLVVADSERILGLHKALTTADDLFQGISEAIGQAAAQQGTDSRGLLEATEVFVYSTTHSTNAILEGRTARTAFLTTRGHRDILLYKEGGKDQVHNWAVPFPRPYIPRRDTFELTERMTSEGGVAVPLDEDEVRRVLARLGELDVEAVAVSLVWAVANPAHERRVGDLIEEVLPGVEYSLGHRVNRIIREYRRASATAIDASLKPLMRRHLRDMDRRLREAGFGGEPLMVTHVSGGVLHLDQIVEQPLQTVDSGPALAPIAGAVFDRAEPSVDRDDVLVVDTGGTSFDVSLVTNGQVAHTREKWLGPRWYGHMTGLPAVDTQSIGAGGGSIASVDAGGLLHVGPESAHSDPGPVAYGRGGTEPTVTDAAVVLGYLNPRNFLGGRMELDVDAARAAIADRLGDALGADAESCAEAVLVVASEQMRGLIVDATIAQGRDARECVLVAGGGAAGINIVRIARELGLREVVIPKLAGGLSAVGGLYSDITAVFSRGHHTLSSTFDFDGVNRALGELDREMSDFLAEVQHEGTPSTQFGCEARYDQQMWEIDVDLGERGSFSGEADVAELKAAFDRNHLALFAMSQPESPIEVTTWRSEARVARPKPSLASANGSAPAAEQATPSGSRTAWFGGEAVDTDVYEGDALTAGMSIRGPAIIEEPTTTIVLVPGSSCTVRASHYLVEIDAAPD